MSYKPAYEPKLVLADASRGCVTVRSIFHCPARLIFAGKAFSRTDARENYWQQAGAYPWAETLIANLQVFPEAGIPLNSPMNEKAPLPRPSKKPISTAFPGAPAPPPSVAFPIVDIGASLAYRAVAKALECKMQDIQDGLEKCLAKKRPVQANRVKPGSPRRGQKARVNRPAIPSPEHHHAQ